MDHPFCYRISEKINFANSSNVPDEIEGRLTGLLNLIMTTQVLVKIESKVRSIGRNINKIIANLHV